MSNRKKIKKKDAIRPSVRKVRETLQLMEEVDELAKDVRAN